MSKPQVKLYPAHEPAERLRRFDVIEGKVVLKDDGMCVHSGEVDLLEDELAQLRTRVAILDAQEAKLPELPRASDEEYNSIAKMRPLAPMNTILALVREKQRERQLLDALRAVQAWRGLSTRYAASHVGVVSLLTSHKDKCPCRLCKAYDALAGKGGE